MAATLKDISKLTGINTGTISHVLNHHPKSNVIREETKKRIFKTAKELGYYRNEMAVTVSTGVNRTVALIGDFEKDIAGYISGVIAGILTSATESDYGVKVYSPSQLDKCLDEILRYRMKEVIVVSLNKECRQRVADFSKKHGLKLVYIFEKSCGFFPAVASSDRIGMRDAVLKLAELGHKRIALICSEPNFHYEYERHAGYLDGLEAAGLSADEMFINSHLHSKDSIVAIKRMLNLPVSSRPTAFLCNADSRAALVINQASLKGLRVPEDISVIGFGNCEICDSTIVPLTSISQPFKAMGTTALNLVLGKDCDINANSRNEYLLSTKLIERESVAICKYN